MSNIYDSRTQRTMKSVQYNGRQDSGGYISNISCASLSSMLPDR